MLASYISAIEYYLPENVVTNEQLACDFSDWNIEQIESKTGIKSRHIAADGECASDLGVKAAQKLFAKGLVNKAEIDFMLFCTQSPDYFLPSSSCIMQDRLGLSKNVGCLDFNLGHSGFIYGLSLAKGLIESGQAKCVLLITAETYSKFIHPQDRSVRVIFGDAGAATLIRGHESPGQTFIGPFVFGTDGSGFQNLIVPVGGRRYPKPAGMDLPVTTDSYGNRRSPENLYMNGAEIFTFTIKVIPGVVAELLEKVKMEISDIDKFIFHQANKYVLEYLRKKIKIPPDKFVYALENIGNTVSCSIPLALKSEIEQGKILPGQKLMLVGYGVGYSWGANLLQWFDSGQANV